MSLNEESKHDSYIHTAQCIFAAIQGACEEMKLIEVGDECFSSHAVAIGCLEHLAPKMRAYALQSTLLWVTEKDADIVNVLETKNVLETELERLDTYRSFLGQYAGPYIVLLRRFMEIYDTIDADDVRRVVTGLRYLFKLSDTFVHTK